MSHVSIYRYLYRWLKQLELGEVYFNRLTMDSTSKQGLDHYVELYLPQGITDRGAFQSAEAELVFGVRDTVKGLPRMDVLEAMASRVAAQFPYNRDGYFFSNFEYESLLYDGLDNHLLTYRFTLIAHGEHTEFETDNAI